MEDNRTPIIIVGTGVNARLALEIANNLDVLVYGFIATDESQTNQEINDILVVASIESQDAKTLFNDSNVKLFAAISDGKDRKAVVDQLSAYPPELVSLVHPHTTISEYSKMGKGNLVYAGTVIAPSVMIGSHNTIGAHTSLGVEVAVGDYCNIGNGVQIGDGVQIHDHVTIGPGAIIHKQVSIGKGALIAPGSVVLRNVGEEASMFGNPAREMEG